MHNMRQLVQTLAYNDYTERPVRWMGHHGTSRLSRLTPITRRLSTVRATAVP